MRVVIAGGGIGGLCLAQALLRAGVEVSVHERDAEPDARTQGYRLNIEPVGSAALHSCLPPAAWTAFLAAAGDPGPGMGVYDGDLRLLMREYSGTSDDPAASTHAISRRSLREILLSGLEDVVQFGRELVRYDEHRDGTVTAVFADGSTADGDLLVGADGARSRVRAQRVPEARITSLGYGIGGKIPLGADTAWLPEELTASKNMVLPDRDFLFTAVYRRRESSPEAERDYVMWAFVGDRTTADDRRPPHDLVRDRTRTWHPALVRMVEESEDIARFDFTAATRPAATAPTSVTLVGDAAHCMPPVGGLGGNTALRDAQVLSGLLIDGSPDPVGQYEAQMRRYGFAAVAESRRYLRLASSPSRTLRRTAHGFFRLCGAVPPLRRAVFDG